MRLGNSFSRYILEQVSQVTIHFFFFFSFLKLTTTVAILSFEKKTTIIDFWTDCCRQLFIERSNGRQLQTWRQNRSTQPNSVPDPRLPRYHWRCRCQNYEGPFTRYHTGRCLAALSVSFLLAGLYKSHLHSHVIVTIFFYTVSCIAITSSHYFIPL